MRLKGREDGAGTSLEDETLGLSPTYFRASSVHPHGLMDVCTQMQYFKCQSVVVLAFWQPVDIMCGTLKLMFPLLIPGPSCPRLPCDLMGLGWSPGINIFINSPCSSNVSQG